MSTECAPIVALNRNVDFKDAAAGLPMPGVDIIIDNPDENGIEKLLVKVQMSCSILQG